MDQYLLIPFLGGWTSIYQLFWCSPGVQGFDTLPHLLIIINLHWSISYLLLTSHELVNEALSSLVGHGELNNPPFVMPKCAAEVSLQTHFPQRSLWCNTQQSWDESELYSMNLQTGVLKCPHTAFQSDQNTLDSRFPFISIHHCGDHLVVRHDVLYIYIYI